MKRPVEQHERRNFLKQSSLVALAGSSGLAGLPKPAAASQQPDQPADQPTDQPAGPRIGSIGTGSRWQSVARSAMQFGQLVAVCDVDQRHLTAAAKTVEQQQGSVPETYRDYAELLARDDIDVVTIVTPDHWHANLAIAAMRAGKDVYCEKPLTLTIEEGNQIIRVLEQTGRVFQVGTQQRSEFGQRFLQAVAICQAGRLGKITKVTCGIGGAPKSDSIPAVEPPAELDWERWQGPAPQAEYRFQKRDQGRPATRCHYEFRWWYEYSGGKMTDWGAHHVDIAQWAIGATDTGPLRITPKQVTHPVPLDADGMPTDPSRYNTATSFTVECEFPSGVIMEITSQGRNGILFEGEQGKLFVNRGSISGNAVEALATQPLPADAIELLYRGKPASRHAHMANFFACREARVQPISDVYSHHRAMTTCHLANIAIRLGRELKWDPDSQTIVDDQQAQAMQSRQARAGYELQG